jgi:hypothetical protein
LFCEQRTFCQISMRATLSICITSSEIETDSGHALLGLVSTHCRLNRPSVHRPIIQNKTFPNRKHAGAMLFVSGAYHRLVVPEDFWVDHGTLPQPGHSISNITRPPASNIPHIIISSPGCWQDRRLILPSQGSQAARPTCRNGRPHAAADAPLASCRPGLVGWSPAPWRKSARRSWPHTPIDSR